MVPFQVECPEGINSKISNTRCAEKGLEMTRCATILIGIAILLMLIYMLSLPFLLEHYFSAPIGLSEITALYSSIITFILGLFGVYIAFQWTAVHKRIDVIKNDVDNEKMKIKDQLDMAKKTNGEMDKYLEVIKKDYRLKITLLVGEMERMMGRENYSQKNYPLAVLNFLRASMVYIFPDHRDNDALFKAILRPAFECAQQSHAGWTEIVS